jgi:hypothetical protein
MLSRSSRHQINFAAITGGARRLESDLITSLQKRRRTASSEAPASALPLLNQFVDGQVRPGSRALRARREKSALELYRS